MRVHYALGQTGSAGGVHDKEKSIITHTHNRLCVRSRIAQLIIVLREFAIAIAV